MYRVQRQNKYRNKTSEYNGIYYASKKEASYAAELDLRFKAKDIKNWYRQIKISLDVNNFHICNYYVDFEILHNDDSLEFIEVKGYETEEWKLKWKLFEALHQQMYPGSSITVIK